LSNYRLLIKQGGAGIGQNVLLGQGGILVDGLPRGCFNKGKITHNFIPLSVIVGQSKGMPLPYYVASFK
jgi:hypothetical protein